MVVIVVVVDDFKGGELGKSFGNVNRKTIREKRRRILRTHSRNWPFLKKKQIKGRVIFI